MADEIAAALAEDDIRGVAVHAWDWSARSENRQLAPSAASDEGRAIANVVTGSERVHLRVVAHSTGALVATAMLDELTAMEVAPYTHVTLIDPFWLFDVVDCNKASVCAVWRNSDDGAPGSDDFVPTTFNVDVTSTRPTNFDERSHWWPIEAWRRSIETRAQPGFGGSLEAGVSLDQLRTLLPAGGGGADNQSTASPAWIWIDPEKPIRTGLFTSLRHKVFVSK